MGIEAGAYGSFPIEWVPYDIGKSDHRPYRRLHLRNKVRLIPVTPSLQLLYLHRRALLTPSNLQRNLKAMGRYYSVINGNYPANPTPFDEETTKLRRIERMDEIVRTQNKYKPKPQPRKEAA